MESDQIPPLLSAYARPKRRRTAGRWLFVIALSIGAWWFLANRQPARRAGASANPDLFAGEFVPRITIQVPAAGMEILQSTGFGDGQPRPSTPAMVHEGDKVYTNVSVHLKGWFGSFRPVGQTPSFTLKFDGEGAEQMFHGLRRISLNNSVQDLSYLSEKISRELFEAAGVPVPRAGHATVTLNDRDLGLYVLTEGYNKQFLSRYFQRTDGNLYESHGNNDVVDSLIINSGDNRADDSALKAVTAALAVSNRAERFRRLREVVDMDRFLSFLAMEVITCHWDGYAMNRNNYRVFHDLSSNKLVFIPTGMDQMFGTGRVDPHCPIVPRMEGAVALAVMETKEGQRQYTERLAQLYRSVFKLDAILARIDSYAAAIQPALAESSRWEAIRNKFEVKRLKQRIIERDKSLREQLSAQ